MGIHRTVVPNALIVTGDEDSIRCRILEKRILTTRVLTEVGDTLLVDNQTVEKVLGFPSLTDATDEFIKPEQIKVELAKRIALEKREKLREDVKAGLRKKAELNKAPLALLTATLHVQQGQPPQVQITVLNLSPKKIVTFRAKVFCLDKNGKPILSPRTGKSSFDALSRFPINPDEEFSTALFLRTYAATKKVNVEITAAQFADKTTWQGRIQEMSL